MQSVQGGAEWLLCAARVCTVYASCAKGAQRSRVVARCTEWLLGVRRMHTEVQSGCYVCRGLYRGAEQLLGVLMVHGGVQSSC